MPEGNQVRRSLNGKPPTALMQSYQAMSQQKRRELKRIGIGLLIFSLVVPVMATVAISAFGGTSLPSVIWVFCGAGMVVGLSLTWPEMGIYMLGRLPKAVGSLLPKGLASKIFKRPDRRNDA